jgi:hypothetical protein
VRDPNRRIKHASLRREAGGLWFEGTIDLPPYYGIVMVPKKSNILKDIAGLRREKTGRTVDVT